MKSPLLSFVLVLAALAHAPAGPRPQGGVRHFSEGGLAFDYPVAWALTDKSDAQTQRLVLTREGGASFIEVVSPREEVKTGEQMEAARARLWPDAAREMARRVGAADFPSEKDYRCPPFGERPGSGVRLSGLSEGQQAGGEVYAMIAGGRYVNLTFFRPEREEAEATAAWKTVLETLKAGGAEGGANGPVIGVVVRGRARIKPLPAYPREARPTRASGEVVVRVEIDERGEVVSARAVSGEPVLYQAAEEAARRTKYEPTTLCGRPVKVSGTLRYNFALH